MFSDSNVPNMWHLWSKYIRCGVWQVSSRYQCVYSPFIVGPSLEEFVVKFGWKCFTSCQLKVKILRYCFQFSDSGYCEASETIAVIQGPANEATGFNFYCQLLTQLCTLHYFSLIACPINVTAVNLRWKKKRSDFLCRTYCIVWSVMRSESVGTIFPTPLEDILQPRPILNWLLLRLPVRSCRCSINH